MDCSKLFNVCKEDWFKALIVAIISGPMGIIVDNAQKFLSDPKTPLSFNYKVLIASAVVGGGAYIIKNFLTGSGGKILTNSQPTPKP